MKTSYIINISFINQIVLFYFTDNSQRFMSSYQFRKTSSMAFNMVISLIFQRAPVTTIFHIYFYSDSDRCRITPIINIFSVGNEKTFYSLSNNTQ